jgi:hypothetical protein
MVHRATQKSMISPIVDYLLLLPQLLLKVPTPTHVILSRTAPFHSLKGRSIRLRPMAAALTYLLHIDSSSGGTRLPMCPQLLRDCSGLIDLEAKRN